MKKPDFSQNKRFLVAILKFSDETESRFFKPLDFTIHYHRTWKFAIRILKISQLVLVLLTKNRFSAAILNFYDQTGSKILKSRLLCPIPGRTWSYAV